MNQTMKISQKGINLIKKWEGVRLNAYQDSVGVWTIGYGHTKGVYKGMTITQNQAENFLKEDIESHVKQMKKLITVNINQNQFDALASFHFNLGSYILQGSTLLKYINGKQWTLASQEMKLYCNAGGVVLQGLVNRRNDEAKLFLKSMTTESKPQTTSGGIKMKKFTLSEKVNLRETPKTTGKLIATLKKGEVININDIVLSGGYIWGVQDRANGKKGYISLGTIKPYGKIS